MKRSAASTTTVSKRQRKTGPASYKKKNKLPLGRPLSFGAGVPDKLEVLHKYSAIVQLAGTTGALGTYRFRANGMYDPDQTGTGHQPRYFDQIGALYNHYVVISSWCEYDLVSTASGNTAMAAAAIIDDDTTATISTLEGMLEKRGAKPHLFPQGSGHPRQKGTIAFSSQRTYGEDPASDSRLAGTTSADPSEETFFRFGVQATDLSSSVTLGIRATIFYRALWYERKEIASS